MTNLILDGKCCLIVRDQTPFSFRPLLRAILVDGSEVVILHEMGYENSRKKFMAIDSESGHIRTVFDGEGLMKLGDVRKTLTSGHKLNEQVRALSLVQIWGERFLLLGPVFTNWHMALSSSGKLVQIQLRNAQVLMLDIRLDQAQIMADLLDDCQY